MEKHNAERLEGCMEADGLVAILIRQERTHLDLVLGHVNSFCQQHLILMEWIVALLEIVFQHTSLLLAVHSSQLPLLPLGTVDRHLGPWSVDWEACRYLQTTEHCGSWSK